MPKLKLTKNNIDKLPLTTGDRIDYCDTELSGFGLRVGKESKTFMVKADAKVIGADSSKKPYKTINVWCQASLLKIRIKPRPDQEI